MAIKRQKLDRKVNLVVDGDRVIDMPPAWQFTIQCKHGGKFEFDFNPYREHGREEIASQMRDAIWSLRHEVVGVSLKAFERDGLRRFWNFLDDLVVTGELIVRLDQIDRALLMRYLAWLELQVVPTGKTKGKAWSLSTKKSTFAHLKTLLINRQKRVPSAVNPNLTFPRNPYPNSNRLTPKREPYSASEQKRIVDALNKDLRAIHEGDDAPLTDVQILVVHLVVLGMATGRNLQSLLELRRDSLREHPLPDRELLTTTKRRGWSTHPTAIRKSATAPSDASSLQQIPASIGDHFRYLCEYTFPLINEADESDRGFAFLWRVSKMERKGNVVRLDDLAARNGCVTFVRRHALLDDCGHPLKLNISRLRPTFGTELYRRTRDIRTVQHALGHSSPDTTARYYADKPIEAERDHAIVLDGMVSHFVRMHVGDKVLLAADGKIPLQGVEDLLSGGYSTAIARCKNPFRGDDSVCKKFFACFKCPSMCVFEDDLWRLFSFYYRLLAERSKINPAQWLKTYGPIIRRIDADIASQFPANKVEEARLKAQVSPHPTWKGPLL